MTTAELIRIVSRSSPMALAQVERVRAELAALHPEVRTEVVPVTTSGDRWMGDLARLGGKGAFTKEVDAALLAGEADLAVHCLKDVPADRPLPAGTVFAAHLRRDDIRDALVHPDGLTLDELPPGTRIGTSSVRRRAQLSASHPHLEYVPIRGNANSRLAKLAAGEADALLLALSGLERIGETARISEVLSVEVMCPPIGAGILALQCRADDTATIDAVAASATTRPGARRAPSGCSCTCSRGTATRRSRAGPSPRRTAASRCAAGSSPRTASRSWTPTSGRAR